MTIFEVTWWVFTEDHPKGELRQCGPREFWEGAHESGDIDAFVSALKAEPAVALVKLTKFETSVLVDWKSERYAKEQGIAQTP